MATWPKILRLRRTDVHEGNLLLNIAKDGSSDLDIALIGTDQEFLYRGSIKESGLHALQTSSSTGDLADWKIIAAYALLHQRPEDLLPEILQGVEAVSAISGEVATITIRRNVGGVTQKLGTISLKKKSDDDDTEVFEWADAAVRDADALRSQMEVLQTSVASQQEEVSRLTLELDQLVKAKKAHEEELLSKFAALLNTKKLKIRDQERLLRNERQKDTRESGDISPGRSNQRQIRQADASRSGKRKAQSTAVADNDDTASEDEDEDVTTENGVLTDGEHDDETMGRQLTPETDDDDLMTHQDVDGPKDANELTAAPDDPRSTTKIPTRQGRSTSQRMDLDSDSSPPPRRALPARQGKAPPENSTAPSTSNLNADVGTQIESEEEEL